MSRDIQFVSQNSNLSDFVNFYIQADKNNKDVIIQIDENKHVVKYADLKETSDHYAKVFRSKSEKDNNNSVRTLMYNAIADYFGDGDKIPQSVKDAMLLNKFDLKTREGNIVATSGKPLTYSRIEKILTAVRKETLNNPTLYAKNFIALMISIPQHKDWDRKVQDEALTKQANLFFDRLFPQEAFNNVTSHDYHKITDRQWEREDKTPGEALREELKDKLSDAIEAFKEGKKDWTKQIGDIIFTATRIYKDDHQKATWCKDVLKQIDTYYTKVPVQDTVPQYTPAAGTLKYLERNKRIESLSKEGANVLSGKKGGVEGKVMTTKDFAVAINSKEKHVCDENPFEFGKGDTVGIAQEIKNKYKEEHPGEEIPPNLLTIELAADRRYCACGLASCWNTQEEGVIRQMRAESLAPLAKHVQTIVDKYGKPHRFEYKSGDDGLDVTEGTMLKSQAAYADYDEIEPFDLHLLFDAMPSFTNAEESFDPTGNLCYLLKTMKMLNPGLRITEAQKNNALKIIEAVLTSNQFDSIRKNGDRFKDLLMLIMFSGPNDKFNVFSSSTGKQLDKLYELIQSNDYQDLLATAETNYENVLRELMKGWVTMARENGTKYFLGTAIGCDSFKNDPRVVARLMAEAFIEYGQGMKYVYCQYSDKSKETRKIFEEEFKKAYQRVQDERAYRNVFMQGVVGNNANHNLLIQPEEPQYNENGITITDSAIRDALPKKDISVKLFTTAPEKSAMKFLTDIKKIAVDKILAEDEKRKQVEAYLKKVLENLFKMNVDDWKSVEEFIDQANLSLDTDTSNSIKMFVSEQYPEEWEAMQPSQENEVADANKPKSARGALILKAFAKFFASIKNEISSDENESVAANKHIFEVLLLQAFYKSKLHDKGEVEDKFSTFTNKIYMIDDNNIKINDEKPARVQNQDGEQLIPQEPGN